MSNGLDNLKCQNEVKQVITLFILCAILIMALKLYIGITILLCFCLLTRGQEIQTDLMVLMLQL